MNLAVDEHIEPDVETLPWWQSKLNLAVVALAVALLCGAMGWMIGNNRAIPDPNNTDVGFLQDMRTHHEQAVFIANIYLGVAQAKPDLQVIARDIVSSQNIEIGRMIQLLRGFGSAETNESDTAMAWMGHASPADRMPGLATEADLNKLANSTGAAADELFAALMIAHHQGGIEMAQYAVEHANVSEVRRLASSMVVGQTSEMNEMRSLITA
jgi:uncharacterized protein (DUF305 family)